MQAKNSPVEDARKIFQEFIFKERVKVSGIGEGPDLVLFDEVHGQFDDEPPTHETVGRVINGREIIACHNELTSCFEWNRVFVLVAVFKDFPRDDFLENTF